MDSFEINNPQIFFEKKEIYNQIIFLTNQRNYKFKNLINIYHVIDIKIITRIIKKFLL